MELFRAIEDITRDRVRDKKYSRMVKIAMVAGRIIRWERNSIAYKLMGKKL